jgi:hypothetical protein
MPGHSPNAATSAEATDALDAATASNLTEKMLCDRLHMARQRYGAFSPNSDVGRQAGREIDLLTGEYRRRGLTIRVLKTGEEPPAKWTRRKQRKDSEGRAQGR